MAKYINADLLKAEFTGNFQDAYTPAHIKAVVDAAPAADVAEVVRCKDCEKHLYDAKYRNWWCDTRKVTPDFFCANGQRREPTP